MTKAAVAKKVEYFGSNNDGQPIQYACASNVYIPKGTLLSAFDPRTASEALVGAGFAGAGILLHDKDASDAKTTVSVLTQGIWDITASGAITNGAPVVFIGENYVKQASLALVSDSLFIVGYAMEDASNAEVINVRIDM